jgi:hypothetical protein
MKHIVFYEDHAQLYKILHHNPLNSYIKVHYSGRRILSIAKISRGSESGCGFACLLLNSILSKYLLCEYANGLPRVWALLCNLRLHSHIFGDLSYRDFDFMSVHESTIKRKLFNRLYAEKYIIYGNSNPTQDLMGALSNYYKADVILRERTDIDKVKAYMHATFAWAVYIGQPWAEIGDTCNEQIQNKLYELMILRMPDVYFCKHPRQKKNHFSKVINGWLSLKNFIRENGPPVLAISLSSSMIYELREMGINAILIASRENCETIIPELHKAIEKASNEISSVC